jgi:DNA helicase-2/ATP-dependent DNA helicase PcrA
MGDKLISAVAEASQLNGGDWPAAMRQIGASKAGNAAGREALLRFAGLRDEWARSASRLNAGSLAAIVLEGSRLVESVNDGTDEGISRAENLAEVVNAASLYGVGELGRFIEAATLDAEMANRATGVSLTIATLHGAKGLEWSIVRLVGCEEGLLPNSRAETLDDYEEERRLFYVGVTRAKRNLVMSAVRMRTLDGHREQRTLSRFVREVRSDDLVDLQRIAPSARAARRNAPRQGQWR